MDSAKIPDERGVKSIGAEQPSARVSPLLPGTPSTTTLPILVIIGLAAIVLIGVLARHPSVSVSVATAARIAPRQEVHPTRSPRPIPTPRPTPTPWVDPHPGCDGANYYRGKAIALSNANAYQRTYDAAVAGLTRVDQCDDHDIPYVKGDLLGAKAVAEHHLSAGNSSDDINQAVTLLSECQTEPGYYGEQGGAHCESEEEAFISFKTQWEMDNY